MKPYLVPYTLQAIRQKQNRNKMIHHDPPSLFCRVPEKQHIWKQLANSLFCWTSRKRLEELEWLITNFRCRSRKSTTCNTLNLTPPPNLHVRAMKRHEEQSYMCRKLLKLTITFHKPFPSLLPLLLPTYTINIPLKEPIRETDLSTASRLLCLAALQ